MLYAFFRIFVCPIIWLLLRPIVYGRENFRVKGKAIFVANHRSMADPIIIAMCAPRFIHFMAKSELFKNKLFGAFLRSCLVFPVNRRTADMSSLKTALKVLEKDKVFGIFPEGRRAVTDEMDEFEKGAAFLAIKSGAPIIPIYIHPNSYKTLHPKLMVGKPMYVADIIADANKSSVVNVVTDKMADAINKLKIEMEAVHCK